MSFSVGGNDDHVGVTILQNHRGVGAHHAIMTSASRLRPYAPDFEFGLVSIFDSKFQESKKEEVVTREPLLKRIAN